jgi:hypothetical protein
MNSFLQNKYRDLKKFLVTIKIKKICFINYALMIFKEC